MNDAPERIWADQHCQYSKKPGGEVEYIRADLVAAIRREVWEEAAKLIEAQRRGLPGNLSIGIPEDRGFNAAINSAAAALRAKAAEMENENPAVEGKA
jgi:hypothetical protein